MFQGEVLRFGGRRKDQECAASSGDVHARAYPEPSTPNLHPPSPKRQIRH